MEGRISRRLAGEKGNRNPGARTKIDGDEAISSNAKTDQKA